MELFRKLKQKIDDGWFRELAVQLRWLRRYLIQFRWTIVIHILLGVLGTLLGLAGSVASKYLIDAVTGHQTGSIGAAAAWMIGLMLGNIAMTAIAGRAGAVLNVRVQNSIQEEVYRKILFADWQALEEFRSGDLLNRLTSDVGTLTGGVVSFIPSALCSTVQLIGALVIMVCHDPTMALISLLVVPVSVLFSRVMVRRMTGHSKEMKEIASDVMSFHQDSFQNLTSIKAFGITDLFCGRMVRMQQRYRDAYLSYNQFSLQTSAFLSLAGMLVSISCFGWGVYQLWTGAITYGTMTLFLQLASGLSSSFSGLVGLVPSMISLSTSTGRIMAVTELAAEATDHDIRLQQETEFSLSLENVSFSYQDGNSVLTGATISADPGDLVALTGPSGEGKTTVLRILLGLVAPQSGTAELIGSSGTHYPLSAVTREAFSYVPQGGSLFAGSIRENLTMVAADATDEQIWEALHLACADEFVKALPDGLDHVLGGRNTGLSEGQGQRLSVARALLRNAPILLLDEATSALDEETEQIMLQRVMTGGRIRTCILVTHRPSALSYCTRGYHIHNGVVQKER